MVSVDGTQFGLYLPHTLTLRQIGDLGALNYAAGLTLSNGTWTRSSAPSHGVDVWHRHTLQSAQLIWLIVIR
ncbi:hypothetical protein N5V81_13290 [Escherichia coli]|nr:hypothetical protein [Escherichia coli]